MGTGSKVKRVNHGVWQLLKSVVGKHLEVTVTDIDISSSWELRTRQSRVKWNPEGSRIEGSTAFIPKRRTWPTGGVWIKVENSDQPTSTDVHFTWKSGRDV